jgi:hypothetical protein
VLGRLESQLARGQPERALETFYRDIVMMTEHDIGGLQAAPTWVARVAAAYTVPRELRAFGAQAFDPEWAARIAVPVLLLVGEDRPAEIKADPDVVAGALPKREDRRFSGDRCTWPSSPTRSPSRTGSCRSCASESGAGVTSGRCAPPGASASRRGGLSPDPG